MGLPVGVRRCERSIGGGRDYQTRDCVAQMLDKSVSCGYFASTMTDRQRRFVAKMEEAGRQWEREVAARLCQLGGVRRQVRPRRVLLASVWPCPSEDLARWQSQSGRCYWCCVDLLQTGYHIDHVQPRRHGGTGHSSNLRLACPSCNLSKCARLPMDFALSLFR